MFMSIPLGSLDDRYQEGGKKFSGSGTAALRQ